MLGSVLLLRFVSKNQVDPRPQLQGNEAGLQSLSHAEDKLLGSSSDHPFWHSHDQVTLVLCWLAVSEVVPISISEELRCTIELGNELSIVH